MVVSRKNPHGAGLVREFPLSEGSPMTKSEAEQGIRYLCSKWASETGARPDPLSDPNFGAFLSWLRNKHPEYLNFRSSTSVADDVERWFDQEFKQTWRN